jgi:hypothetical protein
MSDADAIVELEEHRRKAMLSADTPFFDEHFCDAATYMHSNAEIDNKAEYAAKIDNHHYDYRELNFLDQDIRIVGDAALVTGRMTGEVVIAGQLRKLNSRTTVVWIRQNGRWQMLTFQSTPIPAG